MKNYPELTTVYNIKPIIKTMKNNSKEMPKKEAENANINIINDDYNFSLLNNNPNNNINSFINCLNNSSKNNSEKDKKSEDNTNIINDMKNYDFGDVSAIEIINNNSSNENKGK